MSSRRQMLEFLSLSRLPSAFQEVEYIESSGTQWIDSGIKPDINTKIECEWKQTEIPTGTVINYSGMVLARSSGWCVFGSYGETVGIASYFCDTSRDGATINNDTNWHKIITSNGCQQIDNVITNVVYNNFPSQSDTLQLYLFKGNVNFAGATFLGNQAFKYCKIYDSNILVRDFVPCYRKADNVAGLYDLVNGVFYTNAGTGTFIVGVNV